MDKQLVLLCRKSSQSLGNNKKNPAKHKISVPALHKIAISRKTKSFGTFCLFFFDSMVVWHYQSKYLKDSKSTNFNMQPTPSKTLGNHPRIRRWGKNDPFLSFATTCRGRATYDLNVEAISFQSEAVAAVS